MTSAAILALVEARATGIDVPDRLIERSSRAVAHSRLPSGAYSYSVTPVPNPRGLEGINQIKGSLGRIQVGNLALLHTGHGITQADLRTGLDQFFKYHKFLAIGRGRPIPHGS